MLCDNASERQPRIDTRGLFIMAGAAPNTGWLSGIFKLGPQDFVMTGADGFAASTPGIFAVGDVRAGSVKRVASAVGEGSVVISRVWTYLDALESTKIV